MVCLRGPKPSANDHVTAQRRMADLPLEVEDVVAAEGGEVRGDLTTVRGFLQVRPEGLEPLAPVVPKIDVLPSDWT